LNDTARVPHLFHTVAILAPGLLGASVAMAARSRGAVSRVVVWARRPETRLEIEGQPWCDAVSVTPAEAVAGADLVVLCAPVDAIPGLAAEIAPSLKPGALVTDVGSVKGHLCRAAAAAVGSRGQFIGSHPMAGSEKTGWRAASASLFEDRTCFLTPLPDADARLLDTLARFWAALGARITTTTPDAHDEIVARVSHLPHLAAVTVAATVAAHRPEWVEFAGNGFRDTTRIAAGDPALWRSILEDNRDEVLRALRAFQAQLDLLHAALANEDRLALTRILADAKQLRDRLPASP
jgi:prephenate dehydrogenase